MKRTIALLLSVMMIVGLMPATVLAAANAPKNPRWDQGAYLLAEWDSPADDQRIYLYDIVIFYSESENEPWTYIDFYDDWEKSNAYALDASYVSQYGEGYYKFRVRCSDLSCDGESDWVESAPIYLDLSSGTSGTISAPLSGSFDSLSGALSWSDAENIDSNPQGYRHRAIVDMWYTGANGELDEAQWTLVKSGQVGGFVVSGTTMSSFVYSSDLRNMEEGRYVFTVRNLAEDYLWRGMSGATLLDGYYDHVKSELEALPGPTNLSWTVSRGVYWDHPTDLTNFTGAEFELLYAAAQPETNEGWSTVHHMDFHPGSSAEQWPMMLMELSYMSTDKMQESGIGYYCFRVKYDADNTNLNADSAWVYSDALYYDGSLPSAGSASDLQWGIYHQGNTTRTMVGNIAFYVEKGCRFQLKLYQRDDYGDMQVDSNEGYLVDGWNNFDFFSDNTDRCQTGEYYFTVQLKGSSGSTSDGPVVTSSVWSYTRPDKTLTVTNPKWNTEDRLLDFAIEQDLAQKVYVQYFFNGTEDNAADAVEIASRTYSVQNLPASIPTDLFDRYSDGYYYYKVYVCTGDITQAVSGEWSVFSPALQYKTPDLKLNISDPAWTDDGHLTWTNEFNDESFVDYYDVRFYYGETETQLAANIQNQDFVWWTDYNPAQLPASIPANALGQYGTGYYAYEIRALSVNTMVALNGDWSAMSTFRLVEGASQQAPQATDLQWDLERAWAEEDPVMVKGAISFEGEVPAGADYLEYRIDLYRKESSGDQRIGYPIGTRLWEGENAAEYATVNPFDEFPEVMTTGTYYFTVTTVGDGVTYADSDPVTSGEWTYTRPDKQLTISAPVWNDDMTMSWTDGEAAGDYYQIRMQYVAPGGKFYEDEWRGSMTWYNEVPAKMPINWPRNYGSGTYYFMVRAMSEDVTKAVPSEWSDWSAGFEYTKPDITLDAANLRWNADAQAMEFDLPEGADASMVDSYLIRIYYGDTADNWDYRVGNFRYDPEAAPFTMPEWVIQEEGPGYYWFQVCVYSCDYTRAFDSNGYSDYVSAPLYVKGPDTPAAQATDLQWNVQRWDAEEGYEQPGVLSFKNPCYDGETRTEFLVNVYRRGTDGDALVDTINASSRNQYVTLEPFDAFPEKMTTGTYYFTVVTRGDMINTANSEPALSGTWDYTRPDKQLTISAPVWKDDMTMSWTDGTTGTADYYQFRFQWVPEGGTIDPDDWNSSMDWWPDEGAATVPEWMFEDYGEGDYYFRVRAMSEDVTKIVASDWTGWSTAYTYTEPDLVLTPKNITWDEENLGLNWTVNAPEYVDHYEIQLFHGQEADSLEDVDWFYVEADELPFTLPRWAFENYGPGYYGFTVYAYSNNPVKAKSGDDDGPVIYIQGAEQQLGTPTDLQWHKEIRQIWDPENREYYYTYPERMGNILFKRPVDENGNFLDQAQFDIYIFDADTDALVRDHRWTFGSANTMPYFDVGAFINDDLPSGTYYFMVRARGDGINYQSSDWATSEVWTYVKPAAQLDTPVLTDWNDTDYTDWQQNTVIAATWAPVEGAGYYETQFFFAKNENEAPEKIVGSLDIWADEDPYDTIWDDALSENGPGLYFYKVRAVPQDITAIGKSKWSAMSPAYDLRGTAADVNDQLNALLPSVDDSGETITPSASQIQGVVSNIGLLDEAMATDAAKGESGTLDKLKQLEEIVSTELNVKTDIVVDGLADRFDGSVPAVTAVNMALNVDIEAAAEAKDTTMVTLKVSDANNASDLPETLIDTQKNNTMVFSMDIENAKDADGDAANGNNLLVPVQITLPIPANINRAFLVILHEKSNGTWEELFLPHVFQENGQWYATFNVTSFSNYAIGERAIEAQASGNVVTVEAHLPTCGVKTTYLCAVYSAEHQMLGMGMLEPWAEDALEIELSTNVPADAYVKIFAVDTGAGWTVPSDAIKVAIQ